MPMTEDQRPIVVRSFPASDREFADATGAALTDARADHTDAVTLREAVERRLRGSYRNARIRVQDELADLSTQEVVWYAYRDGRIRDNDPSRERMYAAMATARRTVHDSGLVLEHSRAVSRGAGFDDDSVHAHRMKETRPDEAAENDS